MGVNIDGMKELERKLERTYSPENIKRITDKALEKASDVVLDLIKAEQSKYSDTGETVRQANRTSVMDVNGKSEVTIHWIKTNGSRYTLIHLMEKGWTLRDGTFYTPASMGALQRVLLTSRAVYEKTIKEEIERSLR